VPFEILFLVGHIVATGSTYHGVAIGIFGTFALSLMLLVCTGLLRSLKR
jgi:hypothetical protein